MDYFLGISLGFNSSACLMNENGQILFAASEERYTRIKNCKKFPSLVLQAMRDYYPEEIKNIANVGYTHYQDASLYDLIRHNTGDKIESLKGQFDKFTERKTEINFIKQELKDILGISKIPIRADHHTAHKWCALSFCDMQIDSQKNIYIVTADGFGDGYSATISKLKKSNSENLNIFDLELIDNLPLEKSFGLVYQFVTGALGFKEHEHEGKITGLAAYGDSNEYSYVFDDIFKKAQEYFVYFPELKECENNPIQDFDKFLKLKKYIYNLINDILLELGNTLQVKQDIAAAVQFWLEGEVCQWIFNNIGQDEDFIICLAGGVFANVKLNKKIMEMPEVAKIIVAPPMGDEGGAMGCAQQARILNSKTDLKNIKWPKIDNVYLGKQKESLENVLRKNDNNFNISLVPFKVEQIAKDLSENKIIAVYNLNMEFGPRALGNRSILYNCDTKETNDWLNKQLGRTEFMPFAPIVRYANAKDLFYNVSKSLECAKYMTIALDCKTEFINNYPAACHIDNTARPQIVKAGSFEASILKEYEILTGKKALINTSFNVHGEPIVCSYEDAINTFLKSGIDCLYLCDYKITAKDVN